MEGGVLALGEMPCEGDKILGGGCISGCGFGCMTWWHQLRRDRDVQEQEIYRDTGDGCAKRGEMGAFIENSKNKDEDTAIRP